MDLVKIKIQLSQEEGVKFHPYPDTEGKLTIGIGHNLTDDGISQAVCDLMFQEDIYEVMDDLDKNLPWWQNLDDVRQRVIADLCYNMGIGELVLFHSMLAALVSKDFARAALELQNSKWFSQVGNRGPKLVSMMLLGIDQ